jgi:hypothetical protein
MRKSLEHGLGVTPSSQAFKCARALAEAEKWPGKGLVQFPG